MLVLRVVVRAATTIRVAVEGSSVLLLGASHLEYIAHHVIEHILDLSHSVAVVALVVIHHGLASLSWAFV